MSLDEKPLLSSLNAMSVEADPHGAHGHQGAPAELIAPHRVARTAHLVKDVACGMTIDADTTPHHAEYQGKAYYFCSACCRTKFITDPQRYLRTEATASEPMALQPMSESAIYTCPMHPEVRQVGPGSCPVCGMALEPVVVATAAPPNPELIDMTRRFWIGLVLTLPVASLQMEGHFIEMNSWIEPSLSNWIQLAFASPVVLW